MPPEADPNAAASFVPLEDLAFLGLEGEERLAFLHAVTTQDVRDLRPGDTRYGAILTLKGRMIADLRFLVWPAFVLLEVPRSRRGAVLEELERRIVMDDVRAAAGDEEAFVLFGPGSIDATAAAFPAAALPRGGAPATAGSHEAVPVVGRMRVLEDGVRGLALFRLDWPGVEAVRFVGPKGSTATVRARLRDSTEGRVADRGREAFDAARVEAGIPWFGVDMDEETIPLEAGIEGRAISMTKGCYVGQEVIARIVFQGHVNRKLAGVRFPDRRPSAGESLFAEGGDTGERRELGRVTSVVDSRAFGTIGLAMVRREALTPGTRLRSTGGSEAVVVALPFGSR